MVALLLLDDDHVTSLGRARGKRRECDAHRGDGREGDDELAR